jgi:hypothetical protein
MSADIISDIIEQKPDLRLDLVAKILWSEVSNNPFIVQILIRREEQYGCSIVPLSELIRRGSIRRNSSCDSRHFVSFHALEPLSWFA